MKNVLQYKWRQEQDLRETIAKEETKREKAQKQLLCEKMKAKKKMHLLSQLDASGNLNDCLVNADPEKL